MGNDFLNDWKGSAGNEKANKDSFLKGLCSFLGVPEPGPKDKSQDYCFEKDVQRYHGDGTITTGSIDFYKAGAFAWEAKQGSTKRGKG